MSITPLLKKNSSKKRTATKQSIVHRPSFMIMLQQLITVRPSIMIFVSLAILKLSVMMIQQQTPPSISIMVMAFQSPVSGGSLTDSRSRSSSRSSSNIISTSTTMSFMQTTLFQSAMIQDENDDSNTNDNNNESNQQGFGPQQQQEQQQRKLGIPIVLNPLSKDDATMIKAEATDVVNDIVATGIDELQNLRQQMMQDIQQIKIERDLTSQTRMEQQTQQLMNKIDTMTNDF
jgi:hypothetical protein